MDKLEEKRQQEKELVTLMIKLYCKKKYRSKTSLCPSCRSLYEYAMLRSSNCPFMETKTFCSGCKVHCYKPEMREKIREVMRFSGLRLIFYHPIVAIRHMLESVKNKMHERLEKDNQNCKNWKWDLLNRRQIA